MSPKKPKPPLKVTLHFWSRPRYTVGQPAIKAVLDQNTALACQKADGLKGLPTDLPHTVEEDEVECRCVVSYHAIASLAEARELACKRGHDGIRVVFPKPKGAKL